jgi:hypothetical protein
LKVNFEIYAPFHWSIFPDMARAILSCVVAAVISHVIGLADANGPPKGDWDEKCCMYKFNNWNDNKWANTLRKEGFNKCEINSIWIDRDGGELWVNGAPSGVCGGTAKTKCKKGLLSNKDGRSGIIEGQVKRLTKVKQDFIPANCDNKEQEAEEPVPKCEWDSNCCMFSCNDWTASSSKWLPKTWYRELKEAGLNKCEINAVRVNWWSGELEFNKQKTGVCAGSIHDDCGNKRGNADNRPGTIPQQTQFFAEVKDSLSGADCSKNPARLFDVRAIGYNAATWSTASLVSAVGAAAFFSLVFVVVRMKKSRTHTAAHEELMDCGTESNI